MALDKLVDSTALDGALTATANAIRTKGGTSAQIAFDASTGFATAVAALPSGGGGEPVEEDDVNFYDYDGTLVASYSATDFANLSALPPNPSHSGLTAQGWNWSLSDAKTHVAAYKILDIGQMYTTNDGTTRLYCHFDTLLLTLCIRLYPNGSVSIDWGDNSTPDTMTGTSLNTEQAVSHTYATAGDYVITLTPVSGTFAIKSKLLSPSATASTNNSRVYCNCINKIELGPSVSLSDYALEYCGIKTITLPNTLTAINQYAFTGCYGLSMVVVPDGVTSLGGRGIFGTNASLQHIALPKDISSIGRDVFSQCASLKRITLSASVTSIGITGFYECNALKQIIMPGVTGNGNNQTFTNCYNVEEIVYPSGATNFSTYMFSGCRTLKKLVLPNTVTTLDGYCVQYCSCLSSLILPASLTTINSYCFRDDYGLKELHFKSATPPTVSNANAFTNLPTDCVIYVPTGKLNDYKTASNYPDPNTYTYVEE